MREPQVFHPITSAKEIKTGYPDIAKKEILTEPDVKIRNGRRRDFNKGLHKKISALIDRNKMPPFPAGFPVPGEVPGIVRPGDFSGRPASAKNNDYNKSSDTNKKPTERKDGMIVLGDSIASRAKDLARKKTSGKSE